MKSARAGATSMPKSQPPTASARSRVDLWLEAVTRFSARRPVTVLLTAAVLLAAAIFSAAGLRVSGNFVHLLPSESKTAKRFTTTLERKGGSGSTLIVLVESKSVESNQRFIDDLERDLSRHRIPGVESIEHGPGQARDFYLKWRWLFAEPQDLERLECELGQEVARRSPGYLGLEESCDDERTDAKLGELKRVAEESAEEPGLSSLGKLRRKLEEEVDKVDRFKTNYYRTPEGDIFALVIKTHASGMGEFSTDELFHAVKARAEAMPMAKYDPSTSFGFGGDIPNAIAERDALIDDMTIVSVLAVLLILGAIVLYFRSIFALFHIGFAVALGCGVAFAVARFGVGQLNAATSFLIAIVAGNGINPPIMYLARYAELKGERPIEEALVQTALDTRRGTWLAALAAAGAYGALMVTSFRGFSEFGLIGSVGMLACWFSTFAVCPASLAFGQRLRSRFGWSFGQGRLGRSQGLALWVSRWSTRHPRAVLSAALVATVVAALPLQAYWADPWEYNFANLRSRSSTDSGAGHWSTRAGKVFVSRGSDQLLLVDEMQDAPRVKAALLARDQELYGGKYVERVQTAYDAIGGEPEVVTQKLALLSAIREHIDAVLPHLSGDDQQFARDWRPPEYLRALEVEELPQVLRQRYVEADGRVGTPVYVTLSRDVSQSRGENLLAIANVLEGVQLKSGEVVPNASRAAVFAEMIRSMRRDGPRATLAALLLVVLTTVAVTRSLRGAAFVLGSLFAAVCWMMGAAAYTDLRLNFLNFVALPLTFGIGVEYAINLYDRVRTEGGDVMRGIASAAGPVTLCSVTTILGYGALLSADNQALQSFGRYAIIGEFACIVSAALVLPAALSWAASRRQGVVRGLEPGA
jgi:predicted RND superfamily exporter protein